MATPATLAHPKFEFIGVKKATIGVTADSWLNQALVNTNYGTATTLTIGYNAGNCHGIFAWDFDDVPVTNADTILEQTLVLHQTGGAIAQDGYWLQAHEIDYVDRSWLEAQVTWNSYITGSNWTDAGGDYYATPARRYYVRAQALPATEVIRCGHPIYYNASNPDIASYIVRAYNLTNTYRKTYASKEHGTPEYRPQVIVSYLTHCTWSPGHGPNIPITVTPKPAHILHRDGFGSIIGSVHRIGPKIWRLEFPFLTGSAATAGEQAVDQMRDGEAILFFPDDTKNEVWPCQLINASTSKVMESTISVRLTLEEVRI